MAVSCYALHDEPVNVLFCSYFTEMNLENRDKLCTIRSSSLVAALGNESYEDRAGALTRDQVMKLEGWVGIVLESPSG